MKNRFTLLLWFVMVLHIQAHAQENNLKAYNNFDFVPGESVLFEDDFMDSQDGEFPARWDLVSGQAVVNKRGDKKVCLITEGSYGRIKPAMKNENYLPESFTVEFDFYPLDDSYSILLFFKDAEDDSKALSFSTESGTAYFPNDVKGNYPQGMDGGFSHRWHHASVAYRNGQFKMYIDQHRVLVVPKCGFTPLELLIGGSASQEEPLTFTNFKLAAGGGMNMLGTLLTEGKFVSRAIKFDVNKSIIKNESMGFLNELSRWLKENPSVKLEIGGHTDSDGDDASNLKLSQARADAVKTQLVTMGIDASRLNTKGYGESKPVSNNTTPEGKTLNRRVEFIKI